MKTPTLQKDCLICDRISDIRNNTNPYFVVELNASYVVLGDHQFYKGYTLLLSKIHTEELHLLPKTYKEELLKEIAIVGEAIYKAFKPRKLNYELLGNEVTHLHWHIFPRYKNDQNPTQPIWVVDKKIRNAKNTKPSPRLLAKYKKSLLSEINKILLR